MKAAVIALLVASAAAMRLQTPNESYAAKAESLKAALDAVVRDAKDLETGPPVAGGGFRAPANLLTRRDGPPVFLYRIQTRCKTCVTQSLKFVRPHQQRLRDGDGKESERCWL